MKIDFKTFKPMSSSLKFLDSLKVRIVLNTILAFYMAYIIYHLPINSLLFLDTTLVRVIVILLIGMLLMRVPDVAFFLALAYFISIYVLRGRLEEKFTNGDAMEVMSVQSNGDIMVKDSTGRLIEVSKSVIQYVNLSDPRHLLKSDKAKPEPIHSTPSVEKTETIEDVYEKLIKEALSKEGYELVSAELMETNEHNNMKYYVYKILGNPGLLPGAAVIEEDMTTHKFSVYRIGLNKIEPKNVELSIAEHEMISELKKLGAIPNNLVVSSRIRETSDKEDNVYLSYRSYNVSLVSDSGKKETGTLEVTSGEMPVLKLEEVKENFCGSPVAETNWTPEGGCLTQVTGGGLGNMCNAVRTFPPELNAQGLEQPGPFGYDGRPILGALF